VLSRADHQSIQILLRSLGMLERDSILKWLSLGFRAADIQILFKMFKSFNRYASFKSLKLVTH